MSYNNRGSLYYEQENYQDAFKDFEKALALNPEYALALCNRAAIYQLREQYGAALADLNKACELDKLNPYLLLNRGITKEMLRDEEGACEDWSKAGELGLQQVKHIISITANNMKHIITILCLCFCANIWAQDVGFKKETLKTIRRI